MIECQFQHTVSLLNNFSCFVTKLHINMQYVNGISQICQLTLPLQQIIVFTQQQSMLILNGTIQCPHSFLNCALTSCSHDMTSKLGCMHSVGTFWIAYVLPVHILVPKFSSWSFQVITTGLVSNSQSFQVPWVSIVKCWRHIISNNASSHACYRHKWRSLERNFGFPDQKWCKTCHDSKKEKKIVNTHRT